MTLSLVLLAALAQPAAEPAAPSGVPPQQALAIIDGEGNLRITIVSSSCYGPAAQETTVEASEKQGTEKVPVKVKVSSVMLTTAELPAKYVEAYTVDGGAIKREKLAEMLSKERTVLVALDGKKIDPFLLQLYKEGAIVLVPPANTLGPGADSVFPVPMGVIGPAPVPLPPQIDKKPLPDDKKP